MTEHTLLGKVAVIGGGEKNVGGLLSTTLAEAGRGSWCISTALHPCCGKGVRRPGHLGQCGGPGPMDTPFFYPQENPQRVEFHQSMAMANQLTKIEDIAPIITFLVTDGWWFTGQTLFPNGGYTTR